MSMFRLHCNKCYHHRKYEPTLVFHMTRCHHVLCVKCLETATKDQKKCLLCNAPLQSLPIDRNMPNGMAQYFENPAKHLEKYKSISKFQCQQRTSDNLGFWHQMEQERNLQLQLEGYNKMEAQLNQQIKVERQRIAEMQRYLAYHEQAAAPSTSSQGSSVRERRGSRSSQRRSSQPRPRPRTPSVATMTTDNSISDGMNENNSFLDTSVMTFGPKKRRDDKNFRI